MIAYTYILVPWDIHVEDTMRECMCRGFTLTLNIILGPVCSNEDVLIWRLVTFAPK